jgi:hypothetical protein
MVAAIAAAKAMSAFAPDKASQILRYVGGQYKTAPKPVWESVRTAIHAAQGTGRQKKMIDEFLNKQIKMAPEVPVESGEPAAAAVGAEPGPY